MYRQCQGIPYHDIPYQVKKQVQIEWDIQGQPKLSYYLSSRYMTPGLRISGWLTRNIFLFSVHPVGWNPILEPSAMGRLARTQWKKVSCPQTIHSSMVLCLQVLVHSGLQVFTILHTCMWGDLYHTHFYRLWITQLQCLKCKLHQLLVCERAVSDVHISWCWSRF